MMHLYELTEELVKEFDSKTKCKHIKKDGTTMDRYVVSTLKESGKREYWRPQLNKGETVYFKEVHGHLVMHNERGPAFIDRDGGVQWWLYGVSYSFDAYCEYAKIPKEEKLLFKLKFTDCDNPIHVERK